MVFHGQREYFYGINICQHLKQSTKMVLRDNMSDLLLYYRTVHIATIKKAYKNLFKHLMLLKYYNNKLTSRRFVVASYGNQI